VYATTEIYGKEHKVTITEKLQNNHASFSRRAQEIRADWILSDAAKRQELEGLNTEARSSHEQLTSQYRKDLVQDRQEAP
jgi:cell division septum initiation protein DivIVA